MANIVSREEIEALGLSPATPALVDIDESLALAESEGDEGDGNGIAA